MTFRRCAEGLWLADTRPPSTSQPTYLWSGLSITVPMSGASTDVRAICSGEEIEGIKIEGTSIAGQVALWSVLLCFLPQICQSSLLHKMLLQIHMTHSDIRSMMNKRNLKRWITWTLKGGMDAGNLHSAAPGKVLPIWIANNALSQMHLSHSTKAFSDH